MRLNHKIFIFTAVVLLLVTPDISFATAPTSFIVIPTSNISVPEGQAVLFSGAGTAYPRTTAVRNDYAVGSLPGGITFDPVTNSMWVSNGTAGKLSKLNVTSGTKIDYPSGSLPRAVAFDPITNSVWTTNSNSTTVTKLNVVTGAILNTYSASGQYPTALAFDPVTNSMWVANNSTNNVTKINVTTGAQTSYSGFSMPYGIAFDPITNSMWVTNRGGGAGAQVVTKINVTTGAKISYLTGLSPSGLAFDPITNSMWVTNSSSNTVSKFNVATGNRTDYATPSGPNAVAFDPSTNSMWVTNATANTVSKFDVTTGSRTNYAVGTYPYAVAFDSTTNSIWVANYNSSSVTKLSTGGNSIVAYEWRLGACSTGQILSTSSSFSFSTSTIGTYNIYLRVMDSENIWSTNCPSVTTTVTSSNIVPTVTTPTATSVTSTGAVLGANVTSLGVPAIITARGTCWGITPTPVTNCTPEGGLTTGTFTQARTGMISGTTYYYRGYATNSTGTGYSTDGTFYVLVQPTASITTPAINITIPENQNQQFTGEATDADGTIVGYEWRIGNCTTGTLTSSLISFIQTFFTGTYNVYLRAQDNDGLWSTNCPFRVVDVTPNNQIPGVCGSANGAARQAKPITNLCSTVGLPGPTVLPTDINILPESGIPSSWTWTCSGENGGASASCSSNTSCGDNICQRSKGESPATCRTDCMVSFFEF